MSSKILEGIRVLDFTVVWSGPYASRMLAEMGAEVIHVESPKLFGHVGNARIGSSAKMAKALGMVAIDPISVGTAPWHGVRDTFTSVFSALKRFITLDTLSLEGQEILKKLVNISDVSIENLTPNDANKLGISPDHLRKINPRLICCAMRCFGEGPWRNFVAYGTTMEYLSGINSFTGYSSKAGDWPMRTGVFTVDPIGAMQGVAAIISALMYRKRTGKGTSIEVSQYEGAVSFFNESVIDYTMNKRIRYPIGNNDKDIAFQGCYPSKGDDQWVVLSIRNQDDWFKLCRIIGKQSWLTDEQYNDPSHLEVRREEVDNAIKAWTNKHDKKYIARLLQNINIPAAPVNDMAETVFYPPLRHRQLYKWVKHPYGAISPIQSMPVKFTKTPFPTNYEPAKAVGADNNYVYGELLNLPDNQISELENKQII